MKKKISIILGVISIVIILSILFISKNNSVPTYVQTKINSTEISNICRQIKNSQLQNACLDIEKNKNIEQGISLIAEISDNISRQQGTLIEGKGYANYLDDFPWHYFNNTINLCKDKKNNLENFKKDDYYLCKSFLENPYFCEKVRSDLSENPNNKMEKLCYEDVALLWQDPILCEKSLRPDFCYARLILIILSN